MTVFKNRTDLAGALASAVTTVTGETHTVDTEDDQIILADATANAIAVTLPDADVAFDSDIGTSQKVTIIKVDSSAFAVTVDGAGAETINGNATLVLAGQHDRVTVVSDGTEWHVVEGGESAHLRVTSTQFDFADLGSGATDTLAASVPAGEILEAVAIEIDTAFTAGGGDTTGLTLAVGVNGGDTDSVAEATQLVGMTAGMNRLNAGAQLGEVLASGTYELLLAATGGSTELDHIDAGDATVHVYTRSAPAQT